MSKTIVLREYESLSKAGDGGDHTVSESDWKEIRNYVLSNSDSESQWIMGVGVKTLKAKNYVGVIQTRRGTTVEILPKVELGEGQDEYKEREIFLRMLHRWRDGPCRKFNDADIKIVKNFPLLEAFITMFLHDLHELTRRGLARAYNEVEENRRYLKGKLLIAQHLRYNLAHKERFYVRHEEFSANRPINRLLKSTLLLLGRLSRKESNRSLIRQALLYFEDLPQSPNIDADLIRARVDRTMPLYDHLFPWARLFLKRSAPATWHDDTLAVALLFPMEKIFENYVPYLMRLARDWDDISTQENLCYLMDETPGGEPGFRLRPDIVARRGERELCVLDTKWKHLELTTRKSGKLSLSIDQADLYQMYAYGQKYQAKTGITPSLYLLYPQTQAFREPIHFRYENDLRLTAWPVDLSQEKPLSLDETVSGIQNAA